MYLQRILEKFYKNNFLTFFGWFCDLQVFRE